MSHYPYQDMGGRHLQPVPHNIQMEHYFWEQDDREVERVVSVASTANAMKLQHMILNCFIYIYILVYTGTPSDIQEVS